MILFKQRTERERIIVHAMIRMYCRKKHGTSSSLCPYCSQLTGYTTVRLEKCTFGSSKPVCKDCPVHCYSRDMREKIREVMRWAGPRMLCRHPMYAILHIVDGMTASKPRKRPINRTHE